MIRPKKDERRPNPMCLLIQWGPGKALFAMGKPVCPECGEEAEEALCINGAAGYAHKIEKKGKR